MGGKQKGMNNRSRPEKMSILLQVSHGSMVKKGLGERHVHVTSAFLCDT